MRKCGDTPGVNLRNPIFLEQAFVWGETVVIFLIHAYKGGGYIGKEQKG